jgi:hypothetical protein
MKNHSCKWHAIENFLVKKGGFLVMKHTIMMCVESSMQKTKHHIKNPICLFMCHIKASGHLA